MSLRKGLFIVLLAALALPAAAESPEVNVAQQYGVSFLPLMVMERDKLVEKQAKAAGLGDVKVSWVKVAGPSVMNDGVVSGALQFIAVGAPSLITLWDKTKDSVGVKGVSAMTTYPLYLNVRNPAIKSIKDFSDKDKIALPAVKISIQAVTLQMAAEKAFGEGQQNRLDALTVTLSHPDAQAALLSGNSEIDAHFGSPPFQYQQLRNPAIHTVLNSYDVLGGRTTFNLVWTTSKFRSENPKLYDAFVRALDEATAIVNKDKRAAAEAYLRISKDKDSLQEVEAMLNDPAIVFTTTPESVMKYVDFMAKTGAIKVKADSWKDLFFPNVHGLPGS